MHNEMNNEMDIAEMYGQDGDIGPNPRISALERDIAVLRGLLREALPGVDSIDDDTLRERIEAALKEGV